MISKLQHPQNVLITYQQWWIHESQVIKTKVVSTSDNSATLCARETEVGWPDCGTARVEGPLTTYEEFAKSDLQSKRCSSISLTTLIWYLSHFWIQELRIQNCTSEIKEIKTGQLNQRWTLSGPLPAKQRASLATTATSIENDTLANQLSKW